MTAEYPCPQCGATILFTTTFSVSAVCAYCHSLVVRTDQNLELLGKESILQDDMNPIQIGTRGQFLGTGFTAIGGVRLNHHEGFWQEWYLQLDNPILNSRYAWLVQAQGEYQFLFEPVEISPLNSRQLIVGENVEVSDSVSKKLSAWSKSLSKNMSAFQVVDSRTAQMTHFLGQLPWKPDKDRQRTVAELASTADAKLTVELGDPVSFIYFGRVLNFEDFKFQNLKVLKGW